MKTRPAIATVCFCLPNFVTAYLKACIMYTHKSNVNCHAHNDKEAIISRIIVSIHLFDKLPKSISM